MPTRRALVHLLVIVAPSLGLRQPYVTSRRALLQTSASSALAAAAVATWPSAAHAKCYKNCDTGPAKCYDSTFKEVPCQSSAELSNGVQSADNRAASLVSTPLDVNNMVPSEYKVFPGLYPNIGGKLSKQAGMNLGAFTTKQQLYDTLDSDRERETLRAYDKLIVVKARDDEKMQVKMAGGRKDAGG